MHERQAVVFGVLIAFLALAFVTAAAIYTGNLELPWVNRNFTAKPTSTATHKAEPCPPAGALPVPANQITVNVYNGAGTPGLAGTTATALTERGFVVAGAANALSYSFTGTARISFGVQGIAQAYTLAAYVDDAELSLDTRTDASVDITLGSAFLALKAPEDITLDPNTPLVGATDCVPYDEYITAAATTPTTAETAPADQAPAAG
jgi:hypothetical protein